MGWSWDRERASFPLTDAGAAESDYPASGRTYDQNQIEKPLKVCAKCKRPWFMTDDVCAECEDKYARLRVDVRDCQGVVMNAGE